MTNFFKKGIRRQIILPMLVTMVFAMILIYTFLIYKNEKNIINSSVIFAKSNIEQYLTIRKYYSSNVIDKVLTYSDLDVDVLVTRDTKSIPLPATMIHDLSALLKKEKSQIALNIYSNYPFPNRKDRVLDSFEKDSLKFLENNPKGIFYKRQIYNNKDSVRVVVADILSDISCVSCHNALPNTPKNDWKLNDVRGALEIVIPIEEIVHNNLTNTIQTIILLFLVLFISILVIYISINNKLINSIEKISNFVKNIKNGNLNDELNITQHNELKDLSDNINLMKRSLRNTLNLLHDENKIRKNTENELNQVNNNLEEKIQLRTLELENQNNILQNTLQKLETTQVDLNKSQKMADLGELVGGVTHEINTPLGISITTASFLESITHDLNKLYKSEDMTEEYFENYIKKIEENIKIILLSLTRVATMINSFREIAIDQVIEEKRVFVLNDYISEILLSLKNKTKKQKHTIIIDIKKSITINNYPGYFYQIITNFINNSYLHAFEGIESGEIIIRAVELDNSIELTYEDNGIGIKKEIRENIFKEYYTTKRGKGGTGLGLSIVNDLVINKLKGTIELVSHENEGLKYIITIPKT